MYEQPDPYGPYPTPSRPRPRRHTRGIVIGATAVVAAAAIAGVAYSVQGGDVVPGSGSVDQAAPAMDRQGTGNGPGSIPSGGAGDSGAQGPTGPTGTTGTGTASAAQQVGVVDINTVLKYQRAAAAGTGMVLTSSGEILTNNHVVDGATSISVQVVTTGRTYTATVVGTDPTKDVAVLQLQGASGLQTANIGNAASVAAAQVGASVTGVGNAGGSGGVPSAASGTVVAVNKSLTATDDNGQNPERLTGMIETNAPIAAGDSGGPLYDSTDRVIGMDTAASADRRGTTVGFAIPITVATSIAAEIEAGHETATIHIGYPGFLGVSTAAGQAGVIVESVLPGGPADDAGIAVGDEITAVDATAVGSPSELSAVIGAHSPNQRVSVTWLDTGGQSHHATVTLATGPAD
jgi:S1-C subfamily serine protease